MAKKKKQQGSKINGLPFHSDIADFAKENMEKIKAFKLGKSEDTNFLEYLKPIDILLLHTLRAGMNSKNKSNWRNLETLAEEMGTWSSTVERSVDRLKEVELIIVRKRGKKGGGYAGNEYTIKYPWNPVPLKMRESESLKIREAFPSKQGKSIPSKQGTNKSISTFGTIINQKNKLTSINQDVDEDFSDTPSDQTSGKLEDDILDLESESILIEMFENRKKGNSEDRLLSWLENKGKCYSEQLLDHVQEKMKNRNVRDKYRYTLKCIENIKQKGDPEFNPLTLEEIEMECRGMYGKDSKALRISHRQPSKIAEDGFEKEMELSYLEQYIDT